LFLFGYRDSLEEKNFEGGTGMMGRLDNRQGRFFYDFCLEDIKTFRRPAAESRGTDVM
jgi:hypothetical protein